MLWFEGKIWGPQGQDFKGMSEVAWLAQLEGREGWGKTQAGGRGAAGGQW